MLQMQSTHILYGVIYSYNQIGKTRSGPKRFKLKKKNGIYYIKKLTIKKSSF